MRILFLIGNGFDCNLGLHTTYRDFYKHYLKQFPNDRLATSISNNFEMWSDLELGLGSYVKDIKNADVDTFFDEKMNIEVALTDYLAKEKKRLTLKEGLMEEFLKKLQNFPRELSKKDSRDMTNWINSVRGPIQYSFISFNYTNTLSQIIDLSYKGNPILWHASSQTGYNDELEKPIYIHGLLGDRIVLGVNDKSQIKNEAIVNDPNASNLLIKQELNNQIGELRWEDARDRIDSSQYIIVYGMSLGDTDRNYWKYIYEWLLKNDEKHKLILCVHTNQNVHLSATDYSRQQRAQRDRFIKSAGIKKIDETVLQKIIVINNPKTFDFTHIELKADVEKDE